MGLNEHSVPDTNSCASDHWPTLVVRASEAKIIAQNQFICDAQKPFFKSVASDRFEKGLDIRLNANGSPAILH